MNVPEEVKKHIEAFFSDKETDFKIQGFTSASGGCINNGGTLKTSAGDFFLKWNDAKKFPGMFKVEAKGLRLLKYPGVIKVPKVEHYGEGDTYSYILMENIKSAGRNSSYWKKFGEQLASLHENTSEKYGLDHNNYIGSLPQKNKPLDNWVEFTITQRFEPLVKLAIDSGRADVNLNHDFEKLYGKLRGLLVNEPPSLLHGDLWSGNVLSDGNGAPCIIDPAVYYGNREIELAFTTLFGGFDQEFYNSYNQAWPLESGYQERFDLYNLYPLLVHVNLFGGGYLNQLRQILQQFV
ncbi:MAG: fructosamine kinase family protein [Candidatus Cyclobacteriaceae bacterium M2_1C_046]